MEKISIQIDYAAQINWHTRKFVIPIPLIFKNNEHKFKEVMEELINDSMPYWLWGEIRIKTQPTISSDLVRELVKCVPVPINAAWILRMPDDDAFPPEMIWSANLSGESRCSSPLVLNLSDFRSGRLIPCVSDKLVPVCHVLTDKLPIDTTIFLHLVARMPYHDETRLVKVVENTNNPVYNLRELYLVSVHPALTIATISSIFMSISRSVKQVSS